MKIMTVLGTRPEIIRLSLVIEKLDRQCDHVLVHTGQNYAPELSDIFFDGLGVRPPDRHLAIRSTGFADQIGQIMRSLGDVLAEVRPDRLLLLGDTNSALGALVAARMGIPVYHMEAGNRCYDDRVPEEINRRVIDHCSTLLMPYTERSKDNLVREGIDRTRICVIGNPIWEVLQHHAGAIAASRITSELGVEPKQYFLATLHRSENVDSWPRLVRLVEGLKRVGETYQQPVVLSLHPRTADQLRQAGRDLSSGWLKVITPVGFTDFVRLEQEARLVLSDSGTVQEECCIFHVPNVTLRDTTERPETIEAGSNVLTGADPSGVLAAVRVVLEAGSDWTPPEEYLRTNVSQTVVRILLTYAAQRQWKRDGWDSID